MANRSCSPAPPANRRVVSIAVSPMKQWYSLCMYMYVRESYVYICMYDVCLYAIYVCTYVCFVCMYVCFVRYVCMYVYMYAMYVCMYAMCVFDMSWHIHWSRDIMLGLHCRWSNPRLLLCILFAHPLLKILVSFYSIRGRKTFS